MEWISLILIFLSVVFVFMSIGFAIRPARKEMDRMIGPPKSFGWLNRPLANVIPTSQSKRTRLYRELLMSGRYHSTAVENFLALRNVGVMGVLFGFAVVLVSGMVEEFEKQAFIGAGSMLIVAYGLPRIVLSSRASRRVQEIEHAFPDLLDMISMSIECGIPIEQSLARVAAEFSDTHPSVSREMEIVARQAQTGSFDLALQALGERIDVPDVVACATMLRQGKRLGVKISDAMRQSADRMRDVRRQRAEQAGNLASIKLLLPVVLCLAPPIFILLIGPAVLDFREFIQRERSNVSAVVERADVPDVPGIQKQ